MPSPGEPDHLVRIIGALTNPVGPAPERETVTLLNTSPAEIDLTGWQITDRAGNRHPLTGALAAGDTARVEVAPALPGNRGATITLLDARALKVDGVAHTADQSTREGLDDQVLKPLSGTGESTHPPAVGGPAVRRG